MAERGPAPQAARERWLATLGLAGVSIAFAALASQYVSRVTNNVWGDVAFSGWSAAIGHRVALGERLYRDFGLPIPPGSLVVLSWLEKLTAWGGPSMLLEGLTCAVCHLLMGLFGYAIARPLVGRLNALFVSASALGWICGWQKELGYDHLAQVWAWGGLALLVMAWVSDTRERQLRLFGCAGLIAGTTLFFKQSTALGVIAGGLIGIGYLAFVDRRERAKVLLSAKGMLGFAAGATLGFLACLGGVWLVGGSIAGFLKAIFVDGPALKGGTGFLAAKALFGTIAEPLIVLSLVSVVLVVAIGARILEKSGGFALSSASNRSADAGLEPSLRVRDVSGIAGVSALAFGAGSVLLLLHAKGVPAIFSVLSVCSFFVVQLGCCLAVAFCIGHARSATPARSGRAYNAAAFAAFGSAAAVSMSLMSFRPLDENNSTIVIALVAVFRGLELAGLGTLRWLLLLFMVSAPFGTRLPRALLADNPVPDNVFLRGMTVNTDGLEVVRAAARARTLAGPEGTVLVLPEDPSLAALIGSARPALCGAVVFADQYPERCLEWDLLYLSRHLPRVLVTRPTAPEDWRPIFRQWRADPPAETLTTRFLEVHTKAYEHDSAYRTRWGTGSTSLDIWVLRERR